jgi:hypothetical protein
MSYDDWPDDTMETRRAAIRKTIRPATWQEIAELGEKRFPIVTDPWCVRFQEFLQTHKNATFHRAEAPGGADVVYCREADAGVWFLPGSGMGIIQPKGLKALAEIVDALG